MTYKNPHHLDENGQFQMMLQLHKGNVSSTSTYTPSAEEKALMALQEQYSKYIMPNAMNLNDSAAKMFFDSLGDTQVDYTSQLQDALAQNNASIQGMNNLANGVLPQNYLQNMTDAIQTGVNNTVGSALNNLSQRGVLNSSVTNSAMNDISKNVADTMAQSYTGNIGQLANIYNTQASNAGNGISLGAAGQEAAQAPAMNAWNMSLGLGQNSTNALSSIAGRMGTSTNTQGGGNSFGNSLLTGALGLGSSLIACFTDDTKVTMADGSLKDISNVEVGDEVLSYDKATGNTTVEAVVSVSKPIKQETYVVVCVDDKNARKSVYTTMTQPLLTDDNEFVEVSLMRLGTMLKGVGKVVEINKSEERKVYDIMTEGNNTYFANGFIAYGMFDKE